MADGRTGSQTILVVGGGISGLTSAVEAAEAGYDVVLVEKSPYLGGRVAQLHQYFPKLCPPSCGLEINYRRVKQNPRIRFFTMAEVTHLSGSQGNYHATIQIEPRYVNENCTACGKCADAVGTEISNPFNFGMDKIKAAYLPHPMAFPMRYMLDPSIASTADGKAAQDACAYNAIELDMVPKKLDMNFGAVIWAAGWNPYDAVKLESYGFGQYKNVITNVMMERLAVADGPTMGKIVRPSDGKAPSNVAFIQCAGSRDENHLGFCSGICCLASLKQSTYVRALYPNAKMTIYFIDIRAMERLEDFYVKVQKDPGLSFIKSKVATIEEDPSTGNLTLYGENTMTGEKFKNSADLVVLATGMVPATAACKVPADVTYDEYGFLVNDPAKPGIYGAGTIRRPNDVATCVQDATAAALRAIQSIARR
ncbi:MAG: CoB--CoM heterodisulfide reductase iron-sulfur subunit A family protein [Deltaproteobacteria bacterium]|nr:CoB--CoM heterodisulfide reductase iron-sulfur subunit A family protein [Deltaproteobacteria bacterium]